MADKIGAQYLIGRLARLLTDEHLDFWTREFQAETINEAVRAIIRVRPDSSYKTVDFPTGKTALQKLPEDAYRLMDIAGVINSDGEVCRAILPKPVAELNKIDPCWRTEAATAATEYFAYEEHKPREFWIYPKAPEGHRISLTYSWIPPAIDKNSIELIFRSEFEQDILNYCLYRAYQREGTQTQKEQFYRTVFYEGLGIKTTADASYHPHHRHEKDMLSEHQVRRV